MKNISQDFRGTDNHISEIMEGQQRGFRHNPVVKSQTGRNDGPGFHKVSIERWQPKDLTSTIFYRKAATAMGEILIASTAKGICFAGLVTESEERVLRDLKRRFPTNRFVGSANGYHEEAIRQFNEPERSMPVHFHLKGTAFQYGIWQKLLSVPFGSMTTYKEIAGGSSYARAAGTAIAANPVFYIIPCHRVIRSNGSFDGYFWGPETKRNLLTWEQNNN